MTAVHDPEHNAWMLHIDDPDDRRHASIDWACGSSASVTVTLDASYQEIRDLVRALRRGTVEVRQAAGGGDEQAVEEAGAAEDAAAVDALNALGVDATNAPLAAGAAARPAKDAAVTLSSVDAFVEHFF